VVVNLVCLKVKLRPVALGYRLENSDRAVWGSALWNVRATILRFFKSNRWTTEMECLLERVTATLWGWCESLLTHPDVPQFIQQSIFVLCLSFGTQPFLFAISHRATALLSGFTILNLGQMRLPFLCRRSHSTCRASSLLPLG
jgi:hypothetical protein